MGGAVAGGAVSILVWKIVGSLYGTYSTKARLERKKKQRTAAIKAALKKIKEITEKKLHLEYRTFCSNPYTTSEMSSSHSSIYPSTQIVRPFAEYIYAHTPAQSQFPALQYSNLLESTIDSLDQSIESIKKALAKEHYEIAIAEEKLNSYIEEMLSFNKWLINHKTAYRTELAATLREEAFAQENRDLVVEKEKAEINRLNRESDLIEQLQKGIVSTDKLSKSLNDSLKKLTSIESKVDNLQPSLAEAFSNWSMRSDIGEIKTDLNYIKGRLLVTRI